VQTQDLSLCLQLCFAVVYFPGSLRITAFEFSEKTEETLGLVLSKRNPATDQGFKVKIPACYGRIMAPVPRYPAAFHRSERAFHMWLFYLLGNLSRFILFITVAEIVVYNYTHPNSFPISAGK
jgi:hypothetical protein